jgi:hypothetical protein
MTIIPPIKMMVCQLIPGDSICCSPGTQKCHCPNCPRLKTLTMASGLCMVTKKTTTIVMAAPIIAGMKRCTGLAMMAINMAIKMAMAKI